MRGLFAVWTAYTLLLAAPAAAQDAASICSFGTCRIELTAAQMLARTEQLVEARRFDEAAPMIAALAQAPQMRLQSRYLAGYIASEQGDYARAAGIFKAILADDPNQTRVRLELARAMLGMGQLQGADRQFRIAQQDELPADIARSVRGARDVIRSQRLWRLDMDLGFAPDSNINNATSANTIDIQLGDLSLPIELGEDARAKSGTGQVASLNAGVRLPVSGKAAILADLNGNGTNYAGRSFDDYMLQGAVGPQLHLSDKASVFAQGLAAQRWYGGKDASHQFGARFGGQYAFSDHTRAGLQIDARRTTALFDANFNGWQIATYANAEQALSRTLLATGGLFARRDALVAASYSNVELGGSLGVAGELPWGVNFALGGTASRALYDGPMGIFSASARRDWRVGGNLSLGNRKLRFMGFSPQVNIGWNRTFSNVPFFANDRLRFRFAAARYF